MTTDTREIKLNALPLPDYKEGEYAGPAGEGIGENLWGFDSMVDYAAKSYRKGQSDLIEILGRDVEKHFREHFGLTEDMPK